MMAFLTPLQFNDDKSFLKFINFINSFGHEIIKLQDNKVQILDSKRLAEHFLIAEDNQIYSWEEVKKYCEEASEEELQSAKLRFTIDSKKISLAELKSKKYKVDQLYKSWEVIDFLKSSYSLFLKEIPINNLEELKTAKSALDSSFLNQFLKNSTSLCSLGLSLSSLADPKAHCFALLCLGKKQQVINPVIKDLIKISLSQQLNLRTSLLKTREDKSLEELNFINGWLAEQDNLLNSFKKFFQSGIEGAKQYVKYWESAELESQKLQDEGLLAIKNQTNNLKGQLKSLVWQNRKYAFLKYTSLALTFSLILFPFIGLVVALALSTPVLIPLALLALPPLVFFAVKAYEKIKEKFESLKFDIEMNVWNVNAEILALEAKMEFSNQRKQGNVFSLAAHESLIQEFQTELVKIEEVSTSPSLVTTSVSSVGMFRDAPGVRELPDANEIISLNVQ